MLDQAVWTAENKESGLFVLKGLRRCGVAILGITDGGREGITFWCEHEPGLPDETIVKAIEAAMEAAGFDPIDDVEEETSKKPVYNS
jgi:hypothetical protein